MNLSLHVLAGLFVICLGHYSSDNYTIDVDLNNKIANLNHFWESTGLCPPLPHENASSFLLSDDMMQNLLLLSSVPHDGIKQVRIHWLLELVSKKNTSYDFSDLDRLIYLLHRSNLMPGFEIMGNPSNMFTNFDDLKQIEELKALVTLLAKRYIGLYGLRYVSEWNFETWNEPDHHDFDNVTITVEGFLKYYDACSEGLNSADPSLIFGGPGGSCRKRSYSKRCWALMDHIVNGKNLVTGKNTRRLDYISIHKKGQGKAGVILNTELETILKIHQLYPSLTSTPIYNDEADPLVGWSRPQWWRADATYAAVVAKVISQHQNKIIANKGAGSINYALLSNDNGFLSYSPNYFTQRTLNARFQVNNTDPKYVHFVKKPVLAVMGLMSKLGNIQVNKTMVNDNVGGVSTFCSADTCPDLEVSTLLYNSKDTENVTGSSIISLKYHGLDVLSKAFYKHREFPLTDIRAVTCQVNNAVSNPYQVWKDGGFPNFPTPGLFKKLHAVEEASCLEPAIVFVNERGEFAVKLNLPLPGVLLHHICWRPSSALQKPINFSAYNITLRQVILTWKDTEITSKCIKSYDIQFSSYLDPELFVTINKHKIISNSFTYIDDHPINGSFRVRAIDYWEGKGEFSEILKYPENHK